MAARNVSKANGVMEIARWVVIDGSGATRLTVTYPSLAPNEIAMELLIKVPIALFQKPRLKAEITVPSDRTQPVELTPLVIDNITAAVRQATGLEIVVRQEEAGR